MLKNFLKKNATVDDTQNVFLPNNLSNVTANSKVKNQSVQKSTAIKNSDNLDNLIYELVSNEQFINNLANFVADKVLNKLVQKYNFEPTDKYLEEIESKKQYLGQLDSYLEERKVINKEVENDLQKFLNETTLSLTKALDSFGVGIQKRIKETESKYGIDAMRDVLLKSK